MTQLEPTLNNLLQELRELIDETRTKIAAAVNASLTMLYWRIGKRINEDVLRGERAVYGEQLIKDLSQQLTEEYGRGFFPANLRRMIQFAAVFPDEQIVASLMRQLRNHQTPRARTEPHPRRRVPARTAAQRNPGPQTPRCHPARPRAAWSAGER